MNHRNIEIIFNFKQTIFILFLLPKLFNNFYCKNAIQTIKAINAIYLLNQINNISGQNR